MKPAGFEVSLTRINSVTVLNGFKARFEERQDNVMANEWTCSYGTFDPAKDKIVKLEPRFGYHVTTLTVSQGVDNYMCGLTIRMSSGEVLSAGECVNSATMVVDQQSFEFNMTSNMFMGLGGAPAIGWQSVGAQGIKSFVDMQLLDFYANSDLAKKEPYEFWVSPIEKATMKSGTIVYPSLTQKTQCASSIVRYG